MFYVMPRKTRTDPQFGERLKQLRKNKGITQTELAKAVHTTQPAIAYFENEGKFPTAPVLLALASALKVSVEELVGQKAIKSLPEETITPYLLKKMKMVSKFPEKDRRAIIRMIDLLAKSG